MSKLVTTILLAMVVPMSIKTAKSFTDDAEYQLENFINTTISSLAYAQYLMKNCSDMDATPFYVDGRPLLHLMSHMEIDTRVEEELNSISTKIETCSEATKLASNAKNEWIKASK